MWDVKKVMFYCDTKFQVEKHYQFGLNFITNLLQTEASLKETSWFQYENVFPLW